ncbi:uncharacterized protein LOC121873082 [Homarus americanus]|uniref:uncharacterized protein LOC121873082 n=1 Tax=Homarus americanus TaxID=6706 RepID=UPI001C47CCB0|nr:uncharacterized protein LOC121873082 [Homarus americanus]
MVVVLWQNWGEHVGRQLPHFLAGATLTDVTISVGSRSIKAHRIILAFFSTYFRKMLEEVSEERPMVVVFPGANFDALQVIIAYMYRGQVNVPGELLPHVIELAKLLKVKGLIELPAQLDSVITGSGGKVNHEVITHDNEESQDMCLEGEGMVELEVTAGEPDHLSVTSNSSLSTQHQHRDNPSQAQRVNAKATGVDMKTDEVANSTEHVLIQPEDIQLSTVDDLTPTHIVKLSEDGTMGEVLFSGDYIHGDGSTEEHTSADDSTSLQEDQEYWTAKKRRKVMYKFARYGPEDLQRAIEDVRSGVGSLREIAERWGVPHSTLSVNARLAGVSVQQRNLDYDGETLEAAKQAVKAGSSYMKVAREYNIPKSVLWRRCQREGVLREETPRSYNYSPDDLNQAREMLLNGCTLSHIVKETKIPKTTLFRLKEQLVREGKMPASCINRLMRPRRVSEVSVQQAIAACKEGGMSQSQASEKYQVSKTTVWRRLKQLKQEDSTADSDVKIEVIENLQSDHLNNTYDEEIPMKYTEDGALRYVETVTSQSHVEKTLDYTTVTTSYNTSGNTEKILHRRDQNIQEPKIQNSKGDALATVSDSSMVTSEGRDIVMTSSQSSSFMKSDHLGILTNEGHIIHSGGPLTITQGGKIMTETEGSADGPGNPRFELEMPLMNLPGGGYQVVGSEIVIGGQQMVVLEPPESSQHHQTNPDHHHLVVASFSQMDGLDDLSKVDRTVNVDNLQPAAQHGTMTGQTDTGAEASQNLS